MATWSCLWCPQKETVFIRSGDQCFRAREELWDEANVAVVPIRPVKARLVDPTAVLHDPLRTGSAPRIKALLTGLGVVWVAPCL